jgi:hypothetical protein
LADALVTGRIVPPPILGLEEAPAALSEARTGHADGKTVITL